MRKITLLIADDHEIFRNGIVELMNKEPGIEVLATAANGAEAIEKATQLLPDVIIMDISMPVVNGLEASAVIMDKVSSARIILFSLYDNDDYVTESLRIGVRGYILKDAPNKVFVKAIHNVAEGKFFYSGDLTNALIMEYRQLKDMKSGNGAGVEREPVHLSMREKEILVNIRDGSTNKELSLQYGVSLRTIESHRLNIMRKFRVSQIELAIERAISEGVI